MTRAWLGLGGNIGDVRVALQNAIQRIGDDEHVSIIGISPLYKTPPWGVVDQPWFLNCCAEIETSLAPAELLELCQGAERAGKRERKLRWGPRTIDVDILHMEGIMQEKEDLSLPHPRMFSRAFVLVPLSDIAPHVEIEGRSVASWRAGVNAEDLQVEDASFDWWMVDTS